MKKMTMFDAVKSVFKNYFKFQGRARRSEYWKFSLFYYVLFIVIAVISLVNTAKSSDVSHLGAGYTFMIIYGVITIIPDFSVTCRRLHDTGKSGAYMFIYLVPIVGPILIWIWSIEDGYPDKNIYGPDPKGRHIDSEGNVVYPEIVTEGEPSGDTDITSSFASVIECIKNWFKGFGKGDPIHEPRKRWTCSCGEVMSNECLYCSKCGKPRPEPKRCACGYEISGKEIYCPKCGRKLADIGDSGGFIITDDTTLEEIEFHTGGPDDL